MFPRASAAERGYVIKDFTLSDVITFVSLGSTLAPGATGRTGTRYARFMNGPSNSSSAAEILITHFTEAAPSHPGVINPEWSAVRHGDRFAVHLIRQDSILPKAFFEWNATYEIRRLHQARVGAVEDDVLGGGLEFGALQDIAQPTPRERAGTAPTRDGVPGRAAGTSRRHVLAHSRSRRRPAAAGTPDRRSKAAASDRPSTLQRQFAISMDGVYKWVRT